MSRTPETIISKPLEFIHNAFGFIGAAFAAGTGLSFVLNGNYLLPALISGVSFFVASKIKFKWIKEVEVGGYKRV